MKSIAVFCDASTGNDNKKTSKAFTIDKTLAQQKNSLVYGAAKIGFMRVFANGTLENGGNAIGVIPYFLKNKEISSDALTNLIVTKNMHDRKVIMCEKSDGFITILRGFWHNRRVFTDLTWGSLRLHTKPTIILNTSGYYDTFMQQLKTVVDKDFLKQENIVFL